MSDVVSFSLSHSLKALIGKYKSTIYNTGVMNNILIFLKVNYYGINCMTIFILLVNEFYSFYFLSLLENIYYYITLIYPNIQMMNFTNMKYQITEDIEINKKLNTKFLSAIIYILANDYK